MQTIIMNETRRVSPDGHRLLLLEQKRTYRVSTRVAYTCLRNGWADPSDADVAQFEAYARSQGEPA
jgi:hypothetical protein